MMPGGLEFGLDLRQCVAQRLASSLGLAALELKVGLINSNQYLSLLNLAAFNHV